MNIPSEQKTTFGILRHAQTEWNAQKLIQGQKDSPLTELGISTAREWGKILSGHGWEQILASDLGRVRETVEQIQTFLEIPVQFDPLLREQDWGLWSGQSFLDLENSNGKELAEQVQKGWEFCPPGGESRTTVYARAYQALIEAAKNWPATKVLVVCHEGVIKALLYKLTGRYYLPGEPPLLKKSCLHTLGCTNGLLEVEEINATKLSVSTQ